MKNRRRLKKPVKIILVLIIILVLFIIGFLVTYKIELSSVSKKSNLITFEVDKGSTYNTIAHSLKKNNLIKSEFFYKLYIKIHKPHNLQEGIYELDSNMDVKNLVNTLEGNAKSPLIAVTFKEGINYDDFVKARTFIKTK